MDSEEAPVKLPNESQFADDGAWLSPAVQSLFPSGVIAAERSAPGEAALLFPEERLYVQKAVGKRVQEFAAGRACARRALAEFGIRDFKLLAAADRQPVWPQSMVGSITHTLGYCVAAVALKERILALGVDSERIGQVGPELWSTICCPDESAWCMALADHERPAAMTLLFSAKEAFYKCQYPLTQEWLDFHDLRVEPRFWQPTGAAFRVHLNRPLKIASYVNAAPMGRFLINEGVLTAGIALPALTSHQ